MSSEEVMLMGERFAINAALAEHVEDFRKGALVAQNPKGSPRRMLPLIPT